METLLQIVLQIIAGAVGGNAGGAIVKGSDLGRAGNTIAGALGGVGAGQLLPIIFGGMSAAGFDIGNIAASGIGGLVLQVLVGVVRKMSPTAG